MGRAVIGCAAAVLLGLLGLLAACGPSGATASADCADLIRLDGRVYASAGVTDRVGAPVGTAERSLCDDGGAEPRGAWFPAGADRVTVHRITGRSPDLALAVGATAPSGRGTMWLVYVSVS